jgi:hypothetical protein
MREETGEAIGSFECTQCADGYTPSPSGERCVHCHPSFPNPKNGTCQCPGETHSLINGVCFSNPVLQDSSPFDRRNLYKIKYGDGSTVESNFLKENLLSAYYLCKVSWSCNLQYLTMFKVQIETCFFILERKQRDGLSNPCQYLHPRAQFLW